MGSNIAGFANGFIKKVNRNFEEAKMARYEQFIHDQEQADLKLTRDEEQRIDQEEAAIVAQAKTDAVALARKNQLSDVSDAEKKQRKILVDFFLGKGLTPEAAEKAANMGDTGTALLGQGHEPDKETGIFYSREDLARKKWELTYNGLVPDGADPVAWKQSSVGQQIWAMGADAYKALVAEIGIPINSVYDSQNQYVSSTLRRPEDGPEPFSFQQWQVDDIYTAADNILNVENANELTSQGVVRNAAGNALGATEQAIHDAMKQEGMNIFGKSGGQFGPANAARQAYNGTSEPDGDTYQNSMASVDDDSMQLGTTMMEATTADIEGMPSESAESLVRAQANLMARINFAKGGILNTGSIAEMQRAVTAIENNPAVIEYLRAQAAEFNQPVPDVVIAFDARLAAEATAAAVDAVDAVDAVEPVVDAAAVEVPVEDNQPTAFVDPNELYSTANGISTTEGTGGEVFYSYDDNEGQEKMKAAVQAYIAHINEQKGKVGIGARGSQRDLQSFIAEAFGLKKNITGNLRQRNRDNKKRASALAQLEQQWRSSAEQETL